ncbi:DUF2125 domain-containing protein [Paracoccus sp. (in: a-proteobacteria)]|uniref:DUF2125 domain-containing protein n=1 Tax=Paracoccus sp. TaxID=267 RepID=UPI0026E09389|nr:DUF2125 domain-containing protein [Paracoccus sp. (in: a-proteobacteria)]MDO5369466.1 DUF2125 domain-containing protein [Paracoccus sp. (in: a-proteobacteria)]
MRTLVILMLLIGGTVAGAWLGGETWLARKAQAMIAEDPRIEAASVTPLREIDRIGLGLTGVEIATPAGEAVLPAVELWAAPTSPTQFHAALPSTMTLPVMGRPLAVTAAEAVLSMRVSPGSDMAISRVAAASGPVAIEGHPLLEGLDAQAQLVAMGATAPRTARAAYELGGRLRDLTGMGLLPRPPALADRAISVEGAARVFLTAPFRQAADAPLPELVGVSSDGVTLTLGDQSLRLAGTVRAGDDGRAEGAAFVYTTDARAWLQLAADLGAIPAVTVALADTALQQAAEMPVELPAGVPAPAEPAKGELRVPLIFRDGKAFLGPLPLGEAPLFPA